MNVPKKLSEGFSKELQVKVPEEVSNDLAEEFPGEVSGRILGWHFERISDLRFFGETVIVIATRFLGYVLP